MTEWKRLYLLGLSEREVFATRRDCKRSIRFSWAHRHTMRGRIVVTCNISTLRELKSVGR